MTKHRPSELVVVPRQTWYNLVDILKGYGVEVKDVPLQLEPIIDDAWDKAVESVGTKTLIREDNSDIKLMDSDIWNEEPIYFDKTAYLNNYIEFKK